MGKLFVAIVMVGLLGGYAYTGSITEELNAMGVEPSKDFRTNIRILESRLKAA
jgi:hypothetical protein